MVNSWAIMRANTPFGAVKESGFGREMGSEALDGWIVTRRVKISILPTML